MMRKNVALLYFILLSLLLTAQDNSQSSFYVGTFTSEGAEGIYHCTLDNSTGKIGLEHIFKGIDNPSFLQISPNGNFLYSVAGPGAEIEPSGGYIQSYKIGPEGELLFINKQISNGSDPCHLDISPDGKFAAIATYGSGTISLYQINPNGSLDAAGSTITFEGSGPNQARQKAPHAHSVLFHRNSNTLFSADLGTDRVHLYNLKENKLVPNNQPSIKLAPGAGPRHIRFHPEGKTLYVINELNSTVSVFSKTGNEWKEIQTLSSLPEGYNGTNYCADIHVSPDGRYLYGSNRGHNSIAVFEINSVSNRLEWITSVPSEGNWPRNFVFSPTGEFLLVANQKSGDISVFKINAQNGIPDFTGIKFKIPAPVCLVFR